MYLLCFVTRNTKYYTNCTWTNFGTNFQFKLCPNNNILVAEGLAGVPKVGDLIATLKKKMGNTWPKISCDKSSRRRRKTRISFRFFSCFVEAIKARWGKNLSSCFFLSYQLWLAKKLEELVANLWCFHWKQSLRRIQMMSV